jgi:hypothetical protein
MPACADFEISLHRQDDDGYRLELRFSQPESETDIRLPSPVQVQFDLDGLRALALDAAAYGRLLSQSLFANSEVQNLFAQARSQAQTQEVPLRLQLFIGPSAPELHRLRWETLRDPQDGSSFLTGERVLFSRYLSSFDWRPVRLRPQAALRALVVIASPTDVSSYQPGGRPLAALDVPNELARATTGLGNIPVTALASDGSATLNNLSTNLRGGYDILDLVCHGALIQGEPWLWLEDETGHTHRVAGSELVTRLQELQQCPRLVVLASCQSAGRGEEARTDDAGALAALGPRLAEAGIPAVLAMQGNITMQTVTQFMPVFFQELQRDGQLDRAMAVARGAVRDRPDWWMPVLFMRLKSGRLWYAPGFQDQEGLRKWPALVGNIRRGQCTPILGPGLTESLLGSRSEIARRWAETYHFPMAPHDRESLPQVAQYLAINQDFMFPRNELMEYLRKEMLQRYGSDLPDHQQNASLNALMTAVGAQRRARDPGEPHQVLAGLPFRLYLTTSPSNLLAEALTAAGKEPQVELCRWNDTVAQFPSIYDTEPGYEPDEKRPLVYHLFGRLEQPDSLVLTEDDYFDYLIGVTNNKDLVPAVVRRALTDTPLLFLGFQIDDWNFRVLFRSIMSQEGRERAWRLTHVAAQINPEEGRILEPEGARRYLESYVGYAHISTYWGSVDDFVRELQQRLKGGVS